MSKNRKLKPSQEQKLGEIKKVGEITFVKLPNGMVAVSQIIGPDVLLAEVIAALDQVQTRMIRQYEVLGQSATGADYVKAEKQSARLNTKPD